VPHFTYTDSALIDELTQGDILKRTPALDALLKESHPHYFNKAGNLYFIVLTQSCDLVRRHEGECAARYISLAPVRSLTTLVQRQVSQYNIPELAKGTPVCSDKSRARFQQFLERLFNNNEPEFFYLAKEPEAGFPEDCCALLALSIAIKAELHYKTCVAAKCLQLNENFQAKLGWLVGQMYSRVGTEDWPQQELQEKVKAIVSQSALWIPDKNKRAIISKIAEWQLNNPTESLSASVLELLAKEIPKVKDQVSDRVTEIVEGIFTEAVTAKPQLARSLRNTIKNDPQLANLLKS
jgi:hypothetical protein